MKETLEKETLEKERNVNSTKNRLLYLMQYLYENTDENTQIDTYQLLAYLKEKNIPTDRKTLRADLRTLIDAGMDIVVIRSKPNRYFWGQRLMELPELKLLVDAVLASRFITPVKSRQLIGKLGRLAGISHRRNLERDNIYIAHSRKPMNENIYYVVDMLNDAIAKQEPVSFLYTDYSPEKEKIYRNEGEPYHVSPYALYWNDDFYYLICWSQKHEDVASFRVDRMENVETAEDEPFVPMPAGFDIEAYSKQIVKMYRGDVCTVRINCENELMRYIIDRFGENVHTEVISDRKFCATAEVELSPTFYAWVFQFGGAMQIVSPRKAVLGMRNMAWGIVGKKMEIED